jgi:hypothetical protein
MKRTRLHRFGKKSVVHRLRKEKSWNFTFVSDYGVHVIILTKNSERDARKYLAEEVKNPGSYRLESVDEV